MPLRSAKFASSAHMLAMYSALGCALFSAMSKSPGRNVAAPRCQHPKVEKGPMANDNTNVIRINSVSGFQPLGSKLAGQGCERKSFGEIQAEEGLRLIRAFSLIRDPARRARLIEEAERISRI